MPAWLNPRVGCDTGRREGIPAPPLLRLPFRLWEKSTEFLIFRCSPAARMPSTTGVRRVPPRGLTPCPGSPLLCRTRFLFVCVLYPTRRSNLSMRRPKFKLRCQNSAESRTTTRRCSQSVCTWSLSPSFVPISLSLDRIDSPTHSTLSLLLLLPLSSVTANQMQWQLCSGGAQRRADKHLREWRTAADGMGWAAAAAWHWVAGCLEPVETMCLDMI